MDLVFSVCFIIILGPILILIIFFLISFNKGQCFFIQERPGKNERVFKLYKFKTMLDLYDSHGLPLQDKDRITPIGSIMRKTSLDELPQLFNVLLGDMSLIGPRPLLTEYLSLYSIEEKKRHNVKPGITGWAQVNGRNSLTWKEKFKLDLYYVNNYNFWLDTKILGLTLLKVIKRKDINVSKNQTMQKFNGKN